MSMMGSKKSQAKHNAYRCEWGCCRSLQTGKKAKTRRILRTREQRAWRKDMGR